MELNEKYVYHVYMTKSFTKAAKLLYISQPSLSAAIAAKERELGFRIFDRSSKPISLTAEGEIYIDMLEGIMRCEKDMQHRLKKIREPYRQKICIGSTVYTSYFLLPTVCGAFYRRYPSVEVDLDTGSTGGGLMLYQKLSGGEIDIVFSYTKNEKKYDCLPLFEERIVAAMHKSFLTPQLLPYAVTRDELLSMSFPSEKEKTDIRLFRDIPFIPFDKNGSTVHYMSDILGHYKLAEYSVTNTKHGGLHFNLMCAGVGAIFTSDSAIKTASDSFTEDILFFVFPEEISTRKIYASLRKNEAPSEAVKQFLEVAKEVCSSNKSLSLYYQ